MFLYDLLGPSQRKGQTEGEGRKEPRLRGLTINCHDGKTNK